MSTLLKPALKPTQPMFSSGPCSKRPGWSTAALAGALVGRSHRSSPGKARLKDAIARTKRLLALPEGYEVAIVPGSDTGAFEMAMWNLLGPRGVDAFAWDAFGKIWLKDAVDELKLDDVRTFDAEPGKLPDMSKADFKRDVVFTWNGTTTGVRLPNADWIAADREGLTLCDATSAVFAEDIDMSKIDCLTYSWQKVLGGEAAHGMLILSPRAIARLNSHKPRWPLPKLFRLTAKGAATMDLFEGVTINTPSMLCVEDYIDALKWAEGLGGLSALQARAKDNAGVIYDYIARTPWAEPLPVDAATRSHTSVCLRFADGAAGSAPEKFMAAMTKKLEAEGAALDIGAYRGMPAGLRIWCGATVNSADLEALLPWLDWAYAATKAELGSA